MDRIGRGRRERWPGLSIYTRRRPDFGGRKESPGSDRGRELGFDCSERNFRSDFLPRPVFEHGDYVPAGPADTIDWAILSLEDFTIRVPDGDVPF